MGILPKMLRHKLVLLRWLVMVVVWLLLLLLLPVLVLLLAVLASAGRFVVMMERLLLLLLQKRGGAAEISHQRVGVNARLVTVLRLLLHIVLLLLVILGVVLRLRLMMIVEVKRVLVHIRPVAVRQRRLLLMQSTPTSASAAKDIRHAATTAPAAIMLLLVLLVLLVVAISAGPSQNIRHLGSLVMRRGRLLHGHASGSGQSRLAPHGACEKKSVRGLKHDCASIIRADSHTAPCRAALQRQQVGGTHTASSTRHQRCQQCRRHRSSATRLLARRE